MNNDTECVSEEMVLEVHQQHLKEDQLILHTKCMLWFYSGTHFYHYYALLVLRRYVPIY